MLTQSSMCVANLPRTIAISRSAPCSVATASAFSPSRVIALR